MYQISFVMVREDQIVKQWLNTERFSNKNDAMVFAQNVAKGFNGSNYLVFYRIVYA